MELTDLRDRDHPPEAWRLNMAWPWRIVVKRLVGTHGVVIGHVGAQEPAQMDGIENDVSSGWAKWTEFFTGTGLHHG